MTPPRKSPAKIATKSGYDRRILDLSEIGIRDAVSLGRLHYQRAARSMTPQHHPSWLVLVFLFSGTQIYQIDNRNIAFRGGDMLIIQPGQTYSTGALPEQRSELAWLILHRPERGVGALGMSPAGTSAVFARLCDPSAPLVRPIPEGIRKLVEGVFACWKDRAMPIVSEKIRNQLLAIVLAASETAGAQESGRGDANYRRIRRVLDWLDQNDGEIPNVGDMAHRAGLSRVLFHRHFKQITGCTPHDYELRLKVARAASKLACGTDTSITSLAHDLGFTSSQNFATVFKRYHGISPAAYRAMCRHDSADYP